MRTFEFTALDGTSGRVTAYLHSLISEMPDHRTQYPVVVVCPGGGYNICSQREADPVAFEYFAKGYNVFVLNYSVKKECANFVALKELSNAIMQIRKNAEEWNCDSEKIAVCGFSAGGHLAGSIATLWNNPKFLENFDNENGLNKPNLAVLCYPVLLSGEFENEGSLDNISGKNKELKEFFSLEKRISKETCPCFIWHTVEDNAVPIENSLIFTTELQKNKIPFELHIFPTGGHGASVYTREVKRKVDSLDNYNKQWVNLSINFLNNMFGYEQ